MPVSLPEFCRRAVVTFDNRFTEWKIRIPSYDYFHFFKRSLEPANRIILEAFNYFKTLIAHQGAVNICGVFLESESVEIYKVKKKTDYITIKLAYSPILDGYFCSYGFWLGNGGQSYAPTLPEDLICETKTWGIRHIFLL